MQIKINITLDNAAFEESNELSRILRKLFNDLQWFIEQMPPQDYGRSGKLMDINGNIVGKWEIS